MECQERLILSVSWTTIVCGVAFFWRQTTRYCAPYGRYVDAAGPPGRVCPAKLAWFLQELPAFLVPVLLVLSTEARSEQGKVLLLCTFCLHYFQRTFVYAPLTRGRPVPLRLMIFAAIFCSLNGFLQGHHLLHCARFQRTWPDDVRLCAGLVLFAVGLVINIHSDQILRRLRRPGEFVYRIPHGGLFEFVSGANYLGEMLEWGGYAVATWSLPTFSFAFFTICSIGPRAYHHHRNYQLKFDNYPPGRKAVLPFLL
ncbi:3-oxo-5-alpha-steroid 4-dehydrogenase 2a isoform X2 [Myripristis murdjan]|uniref:3-oxo-5-alpha-steroid 4-dehydrogenase n=1 Tax=Myripristis murdjan TaxID=586833 RepID=A0A667W7L6_9TELE|nr:3-oxo-5-alpha-steroid 4-dehydrogenase 2-like isoform X2 [Myripristis murdjan]